MVIEDYQETQIRHDLFGGTSGTYAGFDRFDRVVDHRWLNYNTSTDIDHFKYGYDRVSNRIWKENTVSKAQTTPVYLDELYTYDGLHRLKTFDRGELNGPKTAITGTPAKEEDWTLDALGNWSGYIQKTAGTTDLNQQRSANMVNEITDITESAGASWVTPAYDKNGNMTLMPQPENPTSSFTCTYDPWNHLVQVSDSTSTIASYSYDALHRRVTKTADSETRHFLYTRQWQAIEERRDTSSSYADRHFIWGPRNIDHLILRDRDTSEPADGVLDERLYALQDANWNLVGLVDPIGDVQRSIYDPFGSVILKDSMWKTLDSSLLDNDYTYTGRPQDRETAVHYYRHRFYHFALSKFFSRDPAGYSGGSNLYSYVDDRPTGLTDPNGTNAWDVWRKMHGLSIYKAMGAQAGGIAQLEPWGFTFPFKVGFATGVYFFPDSCEIGLYSIKAGIAKLLDPKGGPLKISFEGGVQLGLTTELEVAHFTGPGKADAASFGGIFYTIEGSAGEGISIGLSGYKGASNAVGAFWFGGTAVAGVGTDLLPASGGSVAYNYQHVGTLPVVPYCLCLAMILQMP